MRCDCCPACCAAHAQGQCPQDAPVYNAPIALYSGITLTFLHYIDMDRATLPALPADALALHFCLTGRAGFALPEGGTPVYFGDGNTWNTPVDDIYVLHTKLKEQYPHLPLLLMGHSMGSFLSRTYLIRYPGTVKAAVLMGTGWQSAATLAGGLALAGTLARRGAASTNAAVTALAFGAYNKTFKPNRTEYDWLSADEENVDKYIADPLCGHDATVGLFREMLWGIRFNQRPTNLRKMDKTAPVLLISGEDDPVGGMGAGVRQTYQAFRHAGVTDCTLRLYHGLRHELLNEKAHRGAVYQDIWNWMEGKLS